MTDKTSTVQDTPLAAARPASKFGAFADYLSSPGPRGVVHSNSGTVIDVSANGTTSVPAKELGKILFRRFAEMSAAAEAAPLHGKQK